MDIGFVQLAINHGGSYTRKSWNGKFVYYVPPSAYPAQTGEAKKFFGEEAKVKYDGYMAMYCPESGTVAIWLPTMQDILAKDYCKV